MQHRTIRVATIWSCAVLVSLFSFTAVCQKGGGAPGSGPNSSAAGGGAGGAGGGGGGSVAIESQAIAYEAINELAIEIAGRAHPRCADIPASKETKP
jgi:hypothetical protein